MKILLEHIEISKDNFTINDVTYTFKEYFGIWFFQGGTLVDELKVLTNAQEGKTKAMRQWRSCRGRPCATRA